MKLLYTLVILPLLVLLPAGGLLSQNLISNPGFEVGTGDDFTNWSKLNGADYLLATEEAGEVRSGDRALYVSSPGFPGEQWRVQLISDPVPTTVGNSYTFTIWGKAAEAGANIRFSTQPNALYGPDTAVPADVWTQLSWTFTANETMTRIALDLGQTAVTFFLDDAEMTTLDDTPCVDEFDVPDDQQPIATGKGKFLGSIYSAAQQKDHEHYFNQVTPENAGKWGSVERVEGVYDFSDIDEARAYAARNNFPFRYHVLLWGNQQPTWLRPMSDSEKIAKIRAWFQAVADHFDGSSDARATLEYLEVANEIINDPPNGIDNAPYSNNSADANSGDYVNALKTLNAELGTEPGEYDWIVNAFKLARQYFPCEETKLVLNEYNVLTNFLNITDKYLEVVDLLMADDLVDVLGFQAHAFTTRKYDSGSFENHTAFLRSHVDRLAATGLPLQVTELDIDGNVDDTYTPTDDVAVRDSFQKAEYQRIFGMLWNHPAVTGITLWGFRTGHWRSAQLAYLIDPCTDRERPALGEYLNDSIRNGPIPPLNDYAYACPTTALWGGYDQLTTRVELFPNPTRGMTTLLLGTPLPGAELRLYDRLGRELLRKPIGDQQQRIDLDLPSLGLTTGVYFVTIHAGDRQRSLKLTVAPR
ncbi:GH35 family endo-1,4-beta-xylanase [Lewinella aquimaris]|uniref:endo-1,4-beta-xylanase n=1 Tax=Neolewinella aquimaris TaxID=1835722 RepID=A0A840E9Y7_9BACT|nr:endo-1,4-beta-xylanase [Neolewinella aquimaris]MBB4078848.1 GH35 family endo-1,4-beta-xylanase [Neolewinella aquimaris]